MKKFLLGCVLASIVFASRCVCEGGEVALVRDGKGLAEIVVAADAPAIVKYAADELQTYVRKMSGAELPITTKPSAGRVAVYVGESPFVSKLGVRTDDLRTDGFRVAADAGWVALVGRDFKGEPWSSGAHPFRKSETYNTELGLWAFGEAGSLFAVYEFLHDQGVRWYAPGELGEVVPQKPTILIAEGIKKVEPNYRYRYLYFVNFPRSKSHARWFRRLRCGGAAPVYANHSLNRVLNEKLTRTHPDWFAMYDGKRLLKPKYTYGYMPCLSGEGFFEAVVERTRKYFDKKPQEEVCAVMPPDSFRPCTCPKCRRLLTPVRGEQGLASDYVWDFVNRVAIEVKKTHPGKKISCCAYSRYLLPPTRIKRMSDNVVVVICQSRAHMLDAEYAKMIEDVRAGWARILPSREFYVWEYYLTNRYHRMHGLPGFYTALIEEDLKSLRDFARGEFVECNRGPNKNLADVMLNNLNIYLTARLYWEPNLNAAALKEEYYRLFFGPAAATMKRFYEESEKIWMRPVPPKVRYRNMRKLIGEKDVKRLFDLLEAARAQAGKGVYAERVEWMMKDCTPLKSLYGAPPKGRPVVELTSIGAGGNLVIDGKLDEPFWKNLKVYTLRENRTGGKPEEPTRFRILRSNSEIIIGIECSQKNMKKDWAAPRKGDVKEVWKGDVVEIFVATPINDCYQIGVNPLGAWCDMNWDGAEGFGEAVKWDSKLRVATTRTASGWTVELAIPRLTFDKRRAMRPDSGHPWRFNLCRTWRHKGKVSLAAFSPTRSKHFRDSFMFGLLVFK